MLCHDPKVFPIQKVSFVRFEVGGRRAHSRAPNKRISLARRTAHQNPVPGFAYGKIDAATKLILRNLSKLCQPGAILSLTTFSWIASEERLTRNSILTGQILPVLRGRLLETSEELSQE